MVQDYSKQKLVMRAVGIPLIIIGIIVLIIGFKNFASGSFDQAFGNMALFMVGGIMTIAGFALVSWTLIRPISKYYATEASPAIKTVGGALGEGLKESGIGSQKEVIKVKCPHCGYLESEDADFCSKCGKKI